MNDRDAANDPGATATAAPTCQVVRPGGTFDGKQGLTYGAGIATETAGRGASACTC